MLGSPSEKTVKTIEFLNANVAILSKDNAQLVASMRARQTRRSNKSMGKARVLSKEEADRMRAEAEAKEAAELAHKASMKEKKKEQALKKACEEAEKEERQIQRLIRKDEKETNAEMARMAKIDIKRLFN